MIIHLEQIKSHDKLIVRVKKKISFCSLNIRENMWWKLYRSKNSDRVADAEDPARAAGHLARAICMALTPHLGKLKEADLSPLAVRVNLDPDSVSKVFWIVSR